MGRRMKIWYVTGLFGIAIIIIFAASIWNMVGKDGECSTGAQYELYSNDENIICAGNDVYLTTSDGSTWYMHKLENEGNEDDYLPVRGFWLTNHSILSAHVTGTVFRVLDFKEMTGYMICTPGNKMLISGYELNDEFCGIFREQDGGVSLMLTTDGIGWDKVLSLSERPIVAKSDSEYIVFTNNNILISRKGSNWQRMENPFADIRKWHVFSDNNRVFAMTQNAIIALTNNGDKWIEEDSETFPSISAVVCEKQNERITIFGRQLAGRNRNQIRMRFENGMVFNVDQDEPDTQSLVNYFRRFRIGGSDITVMSSNREGVSRSIAYARNRYYIIVDGAIYTSSDGLNWEFAEIPGDYRFSGIRSHYGKVFVVGCRKNNGEQTLPSDSSEIGIYFTSDGSTWNKASIQEGDNISVSSAIPN